MRKKLVESSIGIKTTEATARKIDSLVKSLPKTDAYAFRRKSTAVAETQVLPDLRTDISTITTNSMDRDREIVLPEGLDIADFNTNPIVLFGHDQNKPIGKCLWIKPSANGLTAKSLYTKRPKNFTGEWLPDYVWEMILADVLRGKSIGFIPVEMREPNPQELQIYPNCNNVITKANLFEYSVVSVPANPTALVEAVNKGIGLSQWTFPVVGKVKPKEVKKAVVKAPNYHEIASKIKLNTDEVARKAVEEILMRWEA